MQFNLSRRWLIGILGILGFTLSACSGLLSFNPTPAATVTDLPTNTPAPTATVPPTATIEPTATNTPSPTPRRDPPPLAIFTTRMILGVEPQTYLKDRCEYVQLRWDPNNAEPGTIVVPVMYHGVRKDGGEVKDNITVTEKYFKETMQHAKELGFETITTDQLKDFLTKNAKIPPRSLLLIIDDRRLGTVRNHFLPVLEKYEWEMVLAYITGVVEDQEWAQLKEVLATGRVEIQAHGFLHNGETYFTEFTPDEIIHQELFSPIEAMEKNLGTIPDVFIWPGGNFTAKAIETAHQAGYQLGFTAYSRGPLMFNWVPLGEPERGMQDPLMVLPRYWSTAAYINLDEAVRFGEAAANFAQEQKQAEYLYYQEYCSGYPEIPQP